MITSTDYKELADNIEKGLYEILDIEIDGIQLIIVQEKGKVITSLESETIEASHLLSLENFNKKDLKELNTYINQVHYYNQQYI